MPTSECGGRERVRYPDEVSALTALANLRLQEKRGQQKERSQRAAYRCRDCGGWHLTSR
jgi:hypothetical protein